MRYDEGFDIATGVAGFPHCAGIESSTRSRFVDQPRGPRNQCRKCDAMKRMFARGDRLKAPGAVGYFERFRPRFRCFDRGEFPLGSMAHEERVQSISHARNALFSVHTVNLQLALSL